jgi:hypothetical protein
VVELSTSASNEDDEEAKGLPRKSSGQRGDPCEAATGGQVRTKQQQPRRIVEAPGKTWQKVKFPPTRGHSERTHAPISSLSDPLAAPCFFQERHPWASRGRVLRQRRHSCLLLADVDLSAGSKYGEEGHLSEFACPAMASRCHADLASVQIRGDGVTAVLSLRRWGSEWGEGGARGSLPWCSAPCRSGMPHCTSDCDADFEMLASKMYADYVVIFNILESSLLLIV